MARLILVFVTDKKKADFDVYGQNFAKKGRNVLRREAACNET